MSKATKTIGVPLFFSLLCESVMAAGSVNNATITDAQALDNGAPGAFFVYVNKTVSGSPACATQTTRFAINPGTPAGKVMIAQVLMAQATQTTIEITGTGLCSIWPDTETALWVVSPG